jgi:hypothetical protein
MENRFHNWIRSVGPERVADRMRVNKSTVYRWLSGTTPQPAYVQSLLRKGRGKFSRADIQASGLPQPEITQEHRDAMNRVADVLSQKSRIIPKDTSVP